MLLIVSENSRGSRALTDLVREMSLSLSAFADAEKLRKLMAGASRRIVLIGEKDFHDDIVDILVDASRRMEFGVIIGADRKNLRSAAGAELVDRLMELPIVEWAGEDFNFDRIATAARACRRRLLKVAEGDLKRAFENFEFVVRYQPKVERSDEGETEWLTCEAEALVRWRHPEHGLIGPLEFLPELEAFGMMPKLTEFVLRKAAAQLKDWRKQGLVLNGCINLAPSQLTDEHLGEYYAGIVREFKVEPECFTFEVVEQDLSDPEAPHLMALDSLREAGFRLCLDDFRVAAESLGTFEKLPFDEIKIHASAVRRAQADAVAGKVLAAVVGLAHNLGMTVCAEGVEHEEAFEFLRTIECDKMQGFLISEAVMPGIIRKVYSAGEDDEEEHVA